MPPLLSDPRIRWSCLAMLSFLTASSLFPFTSYFEYHELGDMITVTNCFLCYAVASFIIFVCCKVLVVTKPIVDFHQPGGFVAQLPTKFILVVESIGFVMPKLVPNHVDVSAGAAAVNLVDGTSILMCLPLGLFFLSLCRLSLPGYESHIVIVFAALASRMSRELGPYVMVATMIVAHAFIGLNNYSLSEYGYGVGNQRRVSPKQETRSQLQTS